MVSVQKACCGAKSNAAGVRLTALPAPDSAAHCTARRQDNHTRVRQPDGCCGAARCSARHTTESTAAGTHSHVAVPQRQIEALAVDALHVLGQIAAKQSRHRVLQHPTPACTAAEPSRGEPQAWMCWDPALRSWPDGALLAHHTRPPAAAPSYS